MLNIPVYNQPNTHELDDCSNILLTIGNIDWTFFIYFHFANRCASFWCGSLRVAVIALIPVSIVVVLVAVTIMTIIWCRKRKGKYGVHQPEGDGNTNVSEPSHNEI